MGDEPKVPDDENLAFLKKEKKAPSDKSAETPPEDATQEYLEDEANRQAIHEQKFYTGRVNNMRMQFAWAAIVLAFLWIFIIVFAIFSHGVGSLHVSPFAHVVCGLGNTFIIAVLTYGVFMLLHLGVRYLGKTTQRKLKWALFFRESASSMSAICASIGGWRCIVIPLESIKCNSVHLFERLSDSVLVTLITSTTVSVLGGLGAVMWWLFPRNENKL